MEDRELVRTLKDIYKRELEEQLCYENNEEQIDICAEKYLKALNTLLLFPTYYVKNVDPSELDGNPDAVWSFKKEITHLDRLLDVLKYRGGKIEINALYKDGEPAGFVVKDRKGEIYKFDKDENGVD